MALPNLLASKRGRLTAFFFLYLTEGIPLGFVATAVATELRRQGVGPTEIGAFIASFYLPWSFKFVIGPIVDLFSSQRWGRRRAWIVAAQVMMVLTLVAGVGIDLPSQLKLFTVLLLVHNVFGATQDVAIDALAVDNLEEHERGLANGVMFGAAYLGQTIGGAAVLWLSTYTGFQATFFFVGACIASVTLLVALPLREAKSPEHAPPDGGRAAAVRAEIVQFGRDTWRAFTGSRAAALAVAFALLPPGAMSLSLALQSNLAVEIGLSNNKIATLSFWSAVIAGLACIAGGYISDRLGRRRMLAVYIGLLTLPALYLAWTLQGHGWIMPIDVQAADRPTAPAVVVTTFWVATLVYAAFNGLMYGTRSALFMDVTSPAVAATQFTAYMALLNLTISYSSAWQGWAIDRFGYPATLLADALFGLVCLVLLPFLGKPTRAADAAAEPAAQ